MFNFGFTEYDPTMIQLNLPETEFKYQKDKEKLYIFDVIRNKYVFLSPEEWVRQNYLHFLIRNKKYPKSLISIEKQLTINNLSKRTDILIFDKSGKPDVIVECKSPSVKISQHVFDQIARYNLKLNARILVVTNGLRHFYAKMDHEATKYIFLSDIPEYTK